LTYTPIADGELVAVVTFLEMTERPEVEVPPSPLFLQRMDRPDLASYRDLFRLVGSPWLWFSRLILDDSKLAAIVHDPGIELFEALDGNGRQGGMLELDFRQEASCELAFVGLVPDLAGLGHGRWLLAEAVSRAWRDDVRRVVVHTCTLDHPAAMAAYRRAGFVPFKRAIERFPDPRLSGILPLDSAPHVPLLGTLADPRPES
jgi:GNAT superfamily N-acetyltransferase